MNRRWAPLPNAVGCERAKRVLCLCLLLAVHVYEIGGCCTEPVITEGDADIRVLDDGWTAVSVDDSRSAQFEHTVLITEHGVEILTL